MNTVVRCTSIRWLAAAVLASLSVCAATRADESRDMQALKKATVDGKYTRLLTVIHVPSDKDDYGEFNDYGAYDGTEWAGYSGLPKGYWVYIFPNWYIWEKEGKGGANVPLEKASVDGKYSRLLAVITVPADKDGYGEFNDYGAYDGTEWAGYKGLPPGYWVYVYPRWYIWKNSK
ncbi:MAG TPA: hypothetical protein VMS17_02990 [Gemmataceae bacterium]|nr:hypothetical protein [Gemmataceae bacterium]